MHKDTLLFENPTNGRYYLLYITKDLFGDWVLVKCWGSKNRRGNQQKNVVFASLEKAIIALNIISKRRLKRGYQKTNFK